MGKITIVLSDEKEELLRDYIRSKYRKPFGKLSEVVEESVTRLLQEKGFKGLRNSRKNELTKAKSNSE